MYVQDIVLPTGSDRNKNRTNKTTQEYQCSVKSSHNHKRQDWADAEEIGAIAG